MSFHSEVAAIVEKRERQMNIINRKVVFDMFAEVSARSPVQEGIFRGNWNVSQGEPDTSITNIPDKDGSRFNRELTSFVRNLDFGGVAYLANSLPYAQRIEEGYSPQAATGVIAPVVPKFKRIAEAAIRQVK